MNFKNKKGITLVALVITIIVLLILAGVALSLVLGENGITERAVNAGKTQNISSAKEKLELDVANYGAEFYQAKYVNNDPDATSIQDYIMSKFDDVNNNYADGYKLTKSGYTLTLKSNIGSDRTTATATIGTDGKVSWDGITTASAVACTVSFYSDQELTDLITTITVDSGETIGNLPTEPTKDPDETYTYTFAGWKKSTDDSDFDGSIVISGNLSVYAEWNAEAPLTVSSLTSNEYGQYFNLGTNILDLENITFADNSSPSADWRIFSKDEDGVWLILSDYYPASANSSFITGAPIGLRLAPITSTYPYGVKSNSRINLLNGLTADWTGLLDGSDADDLEGVTAVGALTVTEWQAGWNSKYTGNDQIDIVGNETNGFNEQSISEKEGYNNTLYFPHKSIQSNCNGYWLDSPSASDFKRVMSVGFNGYVGGSGSNYENFGVRPAVHLASDIEIEQDAYNVWSISN